MIRRKICVVTATRAEYGLLNCLLDEIIKDNELELQLIVTGSHLSPEFGYTVEQIIEDGYAITKTIEMILSSDTSVGISKSMGLLQISIAEAYHELQPDIVVVLGDRYELIPIVTAANISKIPVAHLNGGELTEGSLDEIFRHAITKLSRLHFTAIDSYAKRVIKMGENPLHVFNVGEAGLDNIKRIKVLSKLELERSMGVQFQRYNYLITYHPETNQDLKKIKDDFNIILKVLDEQQECLLIFTKANADIGGRIINKMIDAYVLIKSNKAAAFISLGQQRYLSLLYHVDAVIGNSSSGIVEAPSFQVGTINIGNRQKGRVQAESVINTICTVDSIRESFNYLSTSEFSQKLSRVTNPYGDGDSSDEN